MENMRKEYQVPKAEKMEFSYSETVVASGTIVCGSVMRRFTQIQVFRTVEQLLRATNKYGKQIICNC